MRRKWGKWGYGNFGFEWKHCIKFSKSPLICLFYLYTSLLWNFKYLSISNFLSNFRIFVSNTVSCPFISLHASRKTRPNQLMEMIQKPHPHFSRSLVTGGFSPLHPNRPPHCMVYKVPSGTPPFKSISPPTQLMPINRRCYLIWNVQEEIASKCLGECVC